jgi:ABC-type branched-subunit amino acid transport system substrate-binding protein
VNLLADALETSGLNRAALRDAIMAHAGFVGATGAIAWDNGGGNRVEPVLRVLRGATGAEGAGRTAAGDPERTRGFDPW